MFPIKISCTFVSFFRFSSSQHFIIIDSEYDRHILSIDAKLHEEFSNLSTGDSIDIVVSLKTKDKGYVYLTCDAIGIS